MLKSYKNVKKTDKRERGAIMLEGMIITILTIFILVWLFGLGFLYYQRYITTAITNDATVKIASTFNNYSADVVLGYVTTEELSNRNLYRCFTSGFFPEINENRTDAYVNYSLDTTNFNGVVDNVDIELKLVRDSIVRRHIEVTATCSFNTPFNEVFTMFGFDRLNKYSATSCADCTDIADMFSTVNYGAQLPSLLDKTGLVGSIVKLINSCVSIYNHHIAN